ncbi:hypothetical protein T07_13115 [Trichinella nelsoni]|uniref:Uncharacterized protein n=1 Tax=Trichinella nelsoni TaxID=6336 RepID=A0A0V0RHG0_9BILA|nr:hypothetical protein T07_13115 [Trichinella nelsoni]
MGFTTLGRRWMGRGRDLNSHYAVEEMDRKQEGIDGQVFGVRIGGVVHTSYESVVEGVNSGYIIIARYRLKEDGQRRPNYMYKDAGWASQHWVGGGLVGSGGWATRPYTTINALWDEWSAGIQKLIGDAKANTTLHHLSNFEWVVQCCELKKRLSMDSEWWPGT